MEGYVPGYHREDSNNAGHIDKTRHYNSPDANSGVTIGKGVDLARQTPQKLRQDFQIYIKSNGNSGNIDYEEIILNLSPVLIFELKYLAWRQSKGTKYYTTLM